jgi:hypothetical protein
VRFPRGKTRAILRTLIPLLALVWATLPLHHCNLAAAGTGHSSAAGATLPGASAPAVPQAARLAGPATPPHCHQLADPGSPDPAKSPVRCSDLGRAAPDLRPQPPGDPVLAHVTWDTGWLDRGLRPVVLSGAPRRVDDAPWRHRPLHLRKSVLLI